MDNLPPLRLGKAADLDPAPMRALVDAAVAAYAARNPKKAAALLHEAQRAAEVAGLPRYAAKIRKALTLLAQNGKPRLLTRTGYLENEP